MPEERELSRKILHASDLGHLLLLRHTLTNTNNAVAVVVQRYKGVLEDLVFDL